MSESVWPLDREIRCSGCGITFSRTEQGWIVHPEPWCDAMLCGEERPVVI